MFAPYRLHWAHTRELTSRVRLDDLTEAERARAKSLRDPTARASFVTGSRLVRIAVSRETGVPAEQVRVTRACMDCDRPHGRPTVTMCGSRGRDELAGVDVSISHTREWVVVAVGIGARVGVDIEARSQGEALMPAAALVLHRDEVVAGAVPPDALLRTWVRKEALLKASGEGLRLPPSGIRLHDAPRPSVIRWDERPELVAISTLSDLEAPEGFLGAVATVEHQP